MLLLYFENIKILVDIKLCYIYDELPGPVMYFTTKDNRPTAINASIFLPIQYC